MFRLSRPWLSDRVFAIVDDTLCPRSGAQVFGAGMQFDGTRSRIGPKRIDAFRFGHNWVVLAVGGGVAKDIRRPSEWDSALKLAAVLDHIEYDDRRGLETALRQGFPVPLDVAAGEPRRNLGLEGD